MIRNESVIMRIVAVLLCFCAARLFAVVHKDNCLLKSPSESLVTNVFTFSSRLSKTPSQFNDLRYDFKLDKNGEAVFSYFSRFTLDYKEVRIESQRMSLPNYEKSSIRFYIPKCSNLGSMLFREIDQLLYRKDRFRVVTVSNPERERFQILAFDFEEKGTFICLRNSGFKKMKKPLLISVPNDVLPAQFIAEKMFWPVQFRAKIEMSDRFAYRFPDEDLWAFEIKLLGSKGAADKTIHGYVFKKSTLGKKMYEVCKDGNLHSCTITIRCLPNGDGDETMIDECDFTP